MIQYGLKVETLGDYTCMLNEQDAFQVRFKDFNYTEARKKAVYPRHTHVLYEILLIERAGYSCSLDGVHLRLDPGDVLLIQPGQVHEDYLERGCAVKAFHFNLTTLSGTGLTPAVFKPGTVPEQQVLRDISEGPLRTLTGELENFCHAASDNPESYRLCNALFGAVFHYIYRCYSREILQPAFSGQQHIDPEISALRSAFARNLTGMPTLRKLCRDTAMSSTSLFRLCRKVYNMPPRKAFMHYKIMQIQDFMRKNPCSSVKELSHIFGFKTQFHFSRVFCRETGYPPTVLTRGKREKNRKNEQFVEN